MKRRIRVRTPCRLHFGLTSLGHDGERPQYGGVGVMVDTPSIELQISPADQFVAKGPLNERVSKFAALVAENYRLPALPDVNIEVLSTPREHTGFGVGTQLGLSIAAGLAEVLGCPWRDPLRLAQLTHRGRRSAVGTYGFLLGGLIVDGGHLAKEPLGQLAFRGQIPEDWRFMLLTPQNGSGRAGLDEEKAMANLPAVPRQITEELEQLTQDQLLPSLKSGDFSAFSEAVYRYGCLAGKCFAPVQGGTFATPETAELIAWLRSQGIAGVGQSSWGPTVFALLPNESAGEKLRRTFIGYRAARNYDVVCAAPANKGAIIETIE
jgi:beta-ribofuranosylaminobenzene 5'-phosphate synthase